MPAPLARSSRLVALITFGTLGALAPACAETPSASTPRPAVSPVQAAWDACIGSPPRERRGWSQQGPDLVGAHVVGSESRSAFVRTFLLEGMTTKGGAPIKQVHVTPAGLVGQVVSGTSQVEIAGEGWENVRLHAFLDCAGGTTSRPLEARIVAAYRDPQHPAAETWLYRVEILDAAGIPAPACEPDADGETGAMALAGTWDARGHHLDRPAAFTFACAEAAAAKCARWGYSPDSAGDLHAACTRMARADYCGDGDSATQKGTQVNLWDRAGRVSRGPSRSGESFEAAWTAEGAVCMGHPRWLKRAHACTGHGGAGAGAGMNELALPVCRSQAEAEALAGPGKALLFNESSVHE